MSVFQVYKKKTETAKKEYLKQLAAYRASLVSQVGNTQLVLDLRCSGTSGTLFPQTHNE